MSFAAERRARLERLTANAHHSSELEIVPQHVHVRRRRAPLRLVHNEEPVRLDYEPPVIEGYVPKVRDIVSAVAMYFNVTPLLIVSHNRTADAVRPRHIAYYLCRELTVRSYPQIGHLMGGKDHTAVLHGVQKVEMILAGEGGRPYRCRRVPKPDPRLKDDIAMLKAIIRR